MPRVFLLILFYFIFTCRCFSQAAIPDSIQQIIVQADAAKDNKIKWQLALHSLKWGKENNHPAVMANAYRIIANIYRPERDNKLFQTDSQFVKYAAASGDRKLYFDACRLLCTDFLNETRSARADKVLKIMDSITAGNGSAYEYCVINQLRAMYYFKSFKPPKAIEYYSISIPYAEKANNDILKARALIQIGHCYTYAGKTDSAMKYLSDALLLTRRINHDFESASVYDMLGFLFSREGNREKALEYYQQAIRFYDLSGNPVSGAYTTLTIGEMYLGWKQPASAFPWLQKALHVFETLRYNAGLSYTYPLLSRYYAGMNQKDSSDYYAGKKSSVKGAENPYANFYADGQKAIREIELGNYESGDSLLQRVLPEIKDIISRELIESAVDKANAKEFTTQVKEETKVALLSGDAASFKGDTVMVNPFTGIHNNYDSIISDLVVKNGKMVEAVETFKRKELADSNIIARKDLGLAKNELKIKGLTSRFYIFLLIALTITAFLIYAGRKRIIYEKTDANHRLEGNLQVIKANINDVKDRSRHPGEFELLEQKIFPLTALSRLLNRQKSGKVYMQDYLGDICHNVSVAYSLGRDIKFQVEAPVYITGKKASSLGMIVNELVTNSFKYAFPAQSAGEIKVDCSRTRRKYFLSVSDNGRGIPGEPDSQGTGLKLIRDLAHELRAEIVEKRKEGVHFEFYFF